MGGYCLLRQVSGRCNHWLGHCLTDLDLCVRHPTASCVCLNTARQREVWMIVCVCVSRDGRAGEGGAPELNQGNQVWGCPLKPHLWLAQGSIISYLELIIQVHRVNISPQVSNVIADRLREGTNKYCLVKWRIVMLREERGKVDYVWTSLYSALCVCVDHTLSC